MSIKTLSVDGNITELIPLSGSSSHSTTFLIIPDTPDTDVVPLARSYIPYLTPTPCCTNSSNITFGRVNHIN